MRKILDKKNYKTLFITIISLLLTRCNSGGGGSSSTNTVLIPEYSNDKKSSSPVYIPKDYKKILSEIENLKSQLGKDNFKKYVFENRQKKSKYIPTDNIIRNGSSFKLAILDSNFIKHRDMLEKQYPGIIILPTDKNLPESLHGEIVLASIRENSKINLITSSIGVSEGGVYPTIEAYQEALNKFDSNQKVKIFNQSWCYPLTINKFKERFSEQYRNYKLIEYVGGKDILDFYKKQVKEDTLFVWANGNTYKIKNNNFLFEDSWFQAGLPQLVSELETGWIAVIGIQKNPRNIDETRINIHYPEHYAYAGNSKWWSISADAEKSLYGFVYTGSSFAAPRVSKAATLVAEKFDWMTANQVRQTLFTTTDRNEINKNEVNTRRITFEPDPKYGWGMLNENRALKGPGAFINIQQQYQHSRHLNNTFLANIPDKKTSYFENDIYGDGGLEKIGKGTLHLTGNNSFGSDDFNKGTTVKEGTLEIHKIHSSFVNIEKNGTVVLHEKSIIGYNIPNTEIIKEKDISSDKITSKNLINNGTLKISGDGAIIGGDYIGNSGNIVFNDNSKLYVLGITKLKNENLNVLSNSYVTSNGENKILITASNIEGSFNNININGMREIETKITDGNVVATIKRQNAKNYAKNMGESSKNTAVNIENIFDNLDKKIALNLATKEELSMSSTLQNLSLNEFKSATEKISGEIYASAQALSFSQSQNINKVLSNRLASLDNLNITGEEVQTWFSGIQSNGNLKQNGYASAKTYVRGGQFGIDKLFNNMINLGIALSYSYGNAKFNKYAGESKSDMVGVSIYGRKILKNNFYTSGRIGISNISTRVKRELITTGGNTVQGDIKHHDMMTSIYLELGKNINWFTPFIACSNDYLKRGSFSESNASWGIQSNSKEYLNTNFLIGARINKKIGKNKFQSYITQAVNIGKKDLSYEGTFIGSSVKQKFYGIKQTKNTTWVGAGIFREINSDFGIYGNIDARLENNKSRDLVLSTGLQYKF